MAAVVKVESQYNPYAIGVVKGRLERQPKNLVEAVATAKELERLGYNFSLGISQVNRYNLASLGLSYETAFDACHNMKGGGRILTDCYTSASKKLTPKGVSQDDILKAAFSCYYSGNFTTGLKPDFKGQPAYADKVVAAAISVTPTAIKVPQVIPVALTVKASPSSVPNSIPVSGRPKSTANQTAQNNAPIVLESASPVMLQAVQPQSQSQDDAILHKNLPEQKRKLVF
ncbi:lytic transglycosylase (plasmid) [Iodobacter fluviatilis]|uniref:Lytic transglycosylase n=2 Tax=Iodobacter fluviatilis TaxID=537 RepID=A0A7G3GEX4_9NEIS|nr:lytic transglycosylase domain-containing protein [Iodobacter fluviatilis]QBC45886.1 lytic transglycosylase [Iodobacter fluviatilis]